eukprot:11890591-Alexandrium_andersonii.AAC.1
MTCQGSFQAHVGRIRLAPAAQRCSKNRDASGRPDFLGIQESFGGVRAKSDSNDSNRIRELGHATTHHIEHPNQRNSEFIMAIVVRTERGGPAEDCLLQAPGA